MAKADKKKRRNQRKDRQRRQEILRRAHSRDHGPEPTDPQVEKQIQAISQLIENGLMDQACDQAETLAHTKTECWKSWNLLATIQSNLLKTDLAESSFRKVTQLNPDHLPAWQHLGHLLANKRKHREAEECFQRAGKNGQNARSLLDIARNYLIQAKLDQAEQTIAKVFQIAPKSAEAFNLLGLVLLQREEYHQAAVELTKACELDNQFVDAFANLGEALRNLADIETAEQMLLHALSLDPENGNANGFLGLLYSGSGERKKGLEYLEKAVKKNPRYAVFRMQLAKNYINFDGKDRSLELLKYMVDNDLYKQEALKEISAVHCLHYEMPELETVCDKILKGEPDSFVAHVRPKLCIPQVANDWDEIYQIRDRMNEGLDQLLSQKITPSHRPLDDFPNTLFYLTYHGVCCKEINQKISTLFRMGSPEINYTNKNLANLRRLQHPGSKIRVAFMSKHFANHTIGNLNLGLIEQLDRQKFEVLCFTFPGANDKMRNRFREVSDHFEVLPPDHQKTCERIGSFSPDILYYPDIGMDPTTYQVAHARLAPIQCLTFGHPVTTGISTMDYFLSYKHIEPENAQQHYTEKLVILDNFSFCYKRPISLSDQISKELLGFGNDVRLYLCPQTLYKFHPDIDQIFGDILRQDPQGILLCLELGSDYWRRKLLERFSKTIPDVMSRIKWLPRQNSMNFLHLYQIGDVALDPIHFGSGNTALEGISMGTPIVTMPGHFMRSRFTDACYKRLGLEGLTVNNFQQYVDTAVEVANNQELRQQHKEHMHQNCDALFENKDGVRELEAWFQKAVEDHWSQ